jgi:hypothetical protein
MYEADARIELRISSERFLESWHSDQYQANFLGIEDRAHLLQAPHPEAVRLIDHYKRTRIADATFLFCVLLCDLPVGRLKLDNRLGNPVVLINCPFDVFLVAFL